MKSKQIAQSGTVPADESTVSEVGLDNAAVIPPAADELHIPPPPSGGSWTWSGTEWTKPGAEAQEAVANAAQTVKE
jgi:hypothetical protein